MNLLVLLLAVVATSVADVDPIDECTTCILVNTTCFNISHVLDLDAPFRKRIVIHKLGIHRSKNTLFFSFEPLIEDKEYYKVGFVNLDDSSQAGIIAGEQILNFGTFDIDQDNNLIYFGGNDGVFLLDTNTNKMSSYSSRGDTIMSLFYKNYVYFSKYEDNGIVMKNGDNFKTIIELVPVKKFVINKYNIVVYLSNNGLFVSNNAVFHRISKNSYFRGITMDLEGTIYAWWIDGIYKVVIERNNLYQSKLVRVAKLPWIGAITFDNDNNLLFTRDKSLYRMTQTQAKCKR